MHKATAPVDLDRSRGIRFSRTNVRFPRPSVIITMKLGLLALLTLLTNLVQGANTATPIADLNIKEGFAVELLYSVSKEDQGSWVSICTDPKGRLIVSDQYGSLYRLTPPAAGQALETSAIEKIDLPVGQAHGLLYAFDSLYCIVANEAFEGRGLYRIQDTDGDDTFDKVTLLRKMKGGGEHGPHSVVLSPDGQSLYVVVGNQTDLPPMQKTRVPPFWGEDQVLPRVYGRGFMRGTLAPRGFIAKTDPEGKTWELMATGFRNQYDAAFSRDGELFTFDADMEWDVNTPWYRPTRVNHVVSGAEFGWRNGAAKWPAYYEDSLPGIADIGPGSPTGVCFGYGAKFPAKYQDAFFICDWSYGKLYAVHLQPDGATYSADFEEFISAQPLPLTDICVHPGDGALYFTIGGRRTQSGLYRVTYTGTESTASIVQEETAKGREHRNLRRRLEAFHGTVDPVAVEVAWPYLKHEDRNIRYAARVAIESQPITAWKHLALAEKDPTASLQGTMALIRCGQANQKAEALINLVKWKWDDLSRNQHLIWTRTIGLFLARMGGFEKDSDRKKLLRRLTKPFPTGDRDLDIELCQLLVALEDTTIGKRGVDQLESAPTQEEQIAYAKSLRLVTDNWEDADRIRYFAWFQKAVNFRGGASFGKFVESIKKDAVAHLSDTQKEQFADVLKPGKVKGPDFEMKAREYVKQWTVADLEGSLGVGLEGNRDFANGRNLFGATACFACHRFGNEGGAVGPDLTGVAGRFSPKDLLESIIEPSKEISDQYNATVITMNDGSTTMGRIVNLSGDQVMVNINMLDPNAIQNVKRPEVKSMEPSKVSMMPPSLLDTLKEEDILDLLAYLLSGGDQKHELFQK